MAGLRREIEKKGNLDTEKQKEVSKWSLPEGKKEVSWGKNALNSLKLVGFVRIALQRGGCRLGGKSELPPPH